MFSWLRKILGSPARAGAAALPLQTRLHEPMSRKGKSDLADKVVQAIGLSGAVPGDIVEVDDQGAARVVGRRPRLVGQPADDSEEGMRARLMRIYGSEASAMLDDVTSGSNVIVFRKSKATRGNKHSPLMKGESGHE